MRIVLHPQRNDAELAVERQGEALIVNGTTYDFSPLPEGADLLKLALPEPSLWGEFGVEGLPEQIFSARRVDEELEIHLVLPHGPNPGPWQAFPDPIVDPPDGPLDLPWNTYSETVEEKVEGGTNIVTTTHSWAAVEPTVETEFVPDPEPEPEIEAPADPEPEGDEE